MKVIAALVAGIFAQDSWEGNPWIGNSPEFPCGNQIGGFDADHNPRGENFVNKTCTISGPNIKYKFAGGGAFIIDENSFTGYDGDNNWMDLVFFYNQAFDENNKGDNSTCWTASVSCQDTGMVSGVYFMETVNSQLMAKENRFNLQISGVSAGDIISIALNSDDNPFAVANITAPFGTVGATQDAWGNDYSDDGTFTVAVDGHFPFGQFFQIGIQQQAGETGVLNLWKSSVST